MLIVQSFVPQRGIVEYEVHIKNHFLWAWPKYIYRVDCQNTSPHRPCIFIRRNQKFQYYCTLTLALILFYMTIVAPFCHFLLNHAPGDMSVLICMHLFNCIIQLHPPRECFVLVYYSPSVEIKVFLAPVVLLQDICDLSHFFAFTAL